MPTINDLLDNDCRQVRVAPSKTVRAALEHYFRDDDEPVENPEQHQQLSKEPGKNAAGSE
jgi:hypothetical protein